MNYIIIDSISLIVLIVSLYIIVITLKRHEDKERKILTIEECESLIIWRNDPLRKVNPPEKLEKIVERVAKGEVVKVNNEKVYKDILKIMSRTVKFNNLILVRQDKKWYNSYQSE